ncbi:hypothetical protein [Janthinobacterium sp.]|uniref:hypothetical protein n=1 Tax=Janthinobacterium sp. TaxID=1871054 RepID=UPI00293D30FA|nr:hypothetical protein [Janthinobacterium sp.]
MSSLETKSLNPYQTLVDSDDEAGEVVDIKDSDLYKDSSGDSIIQQNLGKQRDETDNVSVATSADVDISFNTAAEEAECSPERQDELSNHGIPDRELSIEVKAAALSQQLTETQAKLRDLRVHTPKISTPSKPDVGNSSGTGGEK